MLIQFRVKNFLSFKEEQVFSMRSQDSKNQAHAFNTEDGRLSLLHGAAIFGANASGKSNLLVAMSRMKTLVLDSAEHKLDKKLPLDAFLLCSSTRDEPVELEIEFMHQNVRYRYGFEATQTGFVSEWLYRHSEKNREARLFERGIAQPNQPMHGTETHSGNELFQHNPLATLQQYSWGKLLFEKQEQKEGFYRVISMRTNPKQLFLSKATALENSETLKPVYDWFKNVLVFDDDVEARHTFEAVLAGKRAEVMEFMHIADASIHDLEIEQSVFDEGKFKKDNPDIPDELFNIARERLKDEKLYKVRSIHLDNQNQPVQFSLGLESSGTHKMLEYAGFVLDVLSQGKVLVVDELEESLHPLLLDYIVKLFNTAQTSAQLIFTSHATHLMTPEKLQRDQIWFVDKNTHQESELYSFMAFSPRTTGRESWSKRYLHGFYGAIPYIKALEIGEVTHGE